MRQFFISTMNGSKIEQRDYGFSVGAAHQEVVVATKPS
jgi:hypothetical protein